MDDLARIRDEIRNHASNALATERGYEPIYSASPRSRIVVIGQAPGKQAQESQVPWNDPSGVKLRQWLGATDAQFYDPDTIALLPMDFYYPGKGAHGDLPPRADFAPLWHPRILKLMPAVRLTVLIGAMPRNIIWGPAPRRTSPRPSAPAGTTFPTGFRSSTPPR